MRSLHGPALPLSRAAALIRALPLGATSARAQELGAVAGTVRDSASATPLAAVLVEVGFPEGAAMTSGVTGPGGAFRLGNVPPGTTLKGSATLRYRDEGTGLNGALRVRASGGFPASSGVYAGDVQGSQIVDVNVGFRVPGSDLWLQLEAQNLLGTAYRTFPGAPTSGRLMLLRLRYDLGDF